MPHTSYRRDASGQFSGEGERNEFAIGCKVTASELRMYTILFDQHRRQFSWQTMSDMYRALLKDGIAEKKKLLKNPSRDMITQMEQAEEIEKFTNEAIRHRQLEDLFSGMDESIAALTRAGDLGAVREILRSYQVRTKRMTDRVLKYRRDMEFDRRWGRLWIELNRGVSLNPKDFEEE